MSSPTPWEACGCVIRDADSIEVCTVALWCKQPSEVAERIARAVNAHEALVEALEPFAALLSGYHGDYPDSKTMFGVDDGRKHHAITYGDLRRAVAAIAKARPQ